MEEILKLSNLTKRYGCLPALDDVSLSLTSGKIIGLLGPNGSGKTTMMKICAGVLTPTSGDVQICGKPVGIESKALVSYLPDRTYLRGNQTLREQLEMFEDFYADFDRKRAEAMLADLRLDLNARFQTLSKGNREKVQLVLVMSRRAKLYLLDEPIGGVDPAARDYILNMGVSLITSLVSIPIMINSANASSLSELASGTIGLLSFQVGLELVIIVAGYFVTAHLMKKKLDLP